MSVLTFLLLLTPLALVFTAFIAWPLISGRSGGTARAAGDALDANGSGTGERGASDRQAAANRAVVAERRVQLDDEIRDLPADSPERARRIAEFTRAALADLEPTGVPVANARRSHTALVIALLVVLLALPLIGYRLYGTPEWPGIVARSQTEERDVRGLVAEVEKRLADHPDDAQGWLLLGRTRIALGEPASGIMALERALAIDSADPALAAQIRADLADALARGEGVDIGGRPAALVREALARAPTHPKALALAGAFAAASGDALQARLAWQKLLAALPAGSDQARQVEALLAQLPDGAPSSGLTPSTDATNDRAETGGPAGSPLSGGPQSGGPLSGGSATGGTAAAGPRLTGRIELDPVLAGKAAPEDTVFVVARGLDGQDEPIGPPVAVKRLRVADLPHDFSLDDSAAMTPAATLSKQPRVRVIARVSASGSARPAPGDLEGSSPPVSHDATGVTVRLDRVVP